MHNKMILGLVVLVLCPLLVRAEPPMKVSAVEVAGAADRAVVTIRCSATPNISSFVQNDPPAVIVDLVGAQCAISASDLKSAPEPIAHVRATQWRTDPQIARVAIELTRSAPYAVERVGNDVRVRFLPVTGSPKPAVERADREFDYAQPEPGEDDQQLVTMIVKDADVAAILQMLAAQFKLNILTTSDVKGTVTFQFNNVPFQTVFDVLVRSAGCNYVKSGDVTVVKPIKNEYVGEMTTRVFNLDYAEAKDVQSAIDKLLSGKGSAEVSYRRIGDGNSSKRSSVLIVTDYAADLDRIQALIQDLDQPVPQISIEAKFIETTLSRDDLYGIDWTIRAGVNTTVPDLEAPKKGSGITLPIHLNEVLLGTLNIGELSAVLDLLKTRGNARLLANPRAITLDNQTAQMTISTQVPVREVRVDPGTQAQTITWRRQAIPVELQVTPHVLADGSIDMDVNPVVEAITGYVGPPTDQQPITSRREAKTQIRVRDGEVAVIGGLVKDEFTKSVTKVPVLGSIPVLGPLLFTQTKISASKSDLLIFIIPHVLPAQ
jgi:type IV pilus secretin PilQ/predicted competence protein